LLNNIMTNNHCTCTPTEYPFYCDRHCLLKTKRKHELCSLEAESEDRGLKYWNSWELGKDWEQECKPDNPILDLKTTPLSTAQSNKKHLGKLEQSPIIKNNTVWEYGVITVEPRAEKLLPKTLKSLKSAGFTSPRLFVDGVSPARVNEIYGKFNLQISPRYPSLKTYGNWMLALWELYIRNPHADRYAIFQDDFTTYKNLKNYLESTPYPEKGYLNLYTFPTNQKLAPENHQGWYRSNQLGRGAVALVFNNESVTELLRQPNMVFKPKDIHRGHKSVDGAIVTAFKKIGWTEYVHNPSLTQHHGEVSSMGNRIHPKADSYRGDNFDALDLMPKSSLANNGLGDKVEQALSSVGITFERVEKWLGKPCGCKERKKKLNKLGAWVQRVLSGDKNNAEKSLHDVMESSNPTNAVNQYRHQEDTLLIAIPARDCEELTFECLEHLAKYAEVPFHVLYIDDGSKEHVSKRVEEKANSLNIQMEILKFNQSIGFAKACNIAFCKPGYRHVLLLNNDCFVGPNCIPRMREWLESEPRIAAVSPMTGDEGCLSLMKDARRKRAEVDSHLIDQYDPIEGSHKCQVKKATSESLLPFFCTIFRSDAIDEIGLQSTHKDYAYGLGADDDWCRRAVAQDWKLLAACDSFAAHLHKQSFKHHNIDRKKFTRIALKRLRKKQTRKPILSVITRVHVDRPRGFRELQKTIEMQSENEIDHVLLHSPGLIGIGAANRLLADSQAVTKALGDYIQVIDDDDMIISSDYVEKLQEFIVTKGYPDWIMCRGIINHRVYPVPWGRKWKPIKATVASFCMITSRKLWETHHKAWGVDQCGDWNFAKALWNAGERPAWFDFNACKAQGGHSAGMGESSLETA